MSKNSKLKNKILIIGLGGMGKAHLASFINKQFTIHIVEKNKKLKPKIIEKKKNIFFFDKLPNRQGYLLTICATRSKERFLTIKKFLENNSTKFLLLEKFCFYSVSQFEKFKNNFNSKTLTFVNSWAYIIAKEIKGFNKNQKFKLVCEISEGNLLSNISHFFHIFGYLNNNNNIKKFYTTNYKIIKSQKRESYDEIKGIIRLEDMNKNSLKIISKKNMVDIMNFHIYQENPNVSYNILIKKDYTICYYKNNKLTKVTKFPFAKKTSFAFLQQCIKKKYDYLPNFINDYSFSKKILSNLNVKIP